MSALETSTAPQRTTNLATLLTQAAARLPDRPAVIRGDDTWTWAQLDDRVSALAAAMRGHGLTAGSVVLLHSPNCMDTLTVLFATWRLGAVIVPTNCKLVPDDVAPLADLVTPDLVICHDTCAPHAAALNGYETWAIGDDRDAARVRQRPRRGTDRQAPPRRGQRRRTGPCRNSRPGTSSPPGPAGDRKPRCSTHDQMAFVVTNHLCDLMPQLTDRDATLVLAPLSHGAGVHALTHVARGAAIVLTGSDTLDAGEAWQLIERHAVSTMFTVPTILNKLVQAARRSRSRHAAACATSSTRAPRCPRGTSGSPSRSSAKCSFSTTACARSPATSPSCLPNCTARHPNPTASAPRATPAPA